jgi:hypothetical protein
MKVIILSAIKDWVSHKFKFGDAIWKESAESLGFGVDKFYNQDNLCSLERFGKLLVVLYDKLNVSEEKLENDFLEYWLTDFAPRLYQNMARQAKNTKTFLIHIAQLNRQLFSIFPKNNVIPKFEIQEVTDHLIHAHYDKENSLVDIVSVLRGASSFFKDTFSIKKLSPNYIEINFNETAKK